MATHSRLSSTSRSTALIRRLSVGATSPNARALLDVDHQRMPSGEGIGRAVKPLGLSAGDTLEAVNGAPSHVAHHAALAA